ncbi:MAG: hypothetical protein RI957_1792 [Verrucomicrobiota bacterium]
MKWCWWLLVSIVPSHADLAKQWDKEIVPILENYCFDCHADGVKKGDFSFDAFSGIPSMQAKRDAWKRVRENLAYELMPPIDKDQPSSDERRKLIEWIDAAVFPVDPKNPDPGRVTLRRLNRFEYQNTVRDLIGVLPDTQLLPPDDSGYGFDNMADVLTLSPTHLEAYLNTASQALDKAYGISAVPKRLIDPRQMKGSAAYEDDIFTMCVGGRRSMQLDVKPGKYRITFRLSGQQAGEEKVKARILVGSVINEITVGNTDPVDFAITTDLSEEQRAMGVEYLNDYWDERTKADRNLLVHSITLEGPLDQQRKRNLLLFPERKEGQNDDQYIATVLRNFLSHAFRRPAADAEIASYAGLMKAQRKDKQSLEDAMRPAFEAAMISPQFLFRELHAVYSLDKPGTILQVPELSLASRISYFLWSSAPEDSTLSLAANKQLRPLIKEEVDRMIRSPKTSALIDRFFAQWLQYQDAAFIAIDSKLYPAAAGSLRDDMIMESKVFCEDMLKNNLPVTRLIDADYTFVNESLASHYQMPRVEGREFRKVMLPDPMRRGILTHGSILAVTSNPNRTSPVKRGKWVLETLLDAAPPPPPPNVPSLPASHQGISSASLRAQLELHRKDPACASCHKLMDGIGFAFEAYDVDGSRRKGPDIDTRGNLASGEVVDSPASLSKILATKRADEFHRAFAVKMLTFALGRGLDYYDKPAVDKIVAFAAKNHYSLHSYIHATIYSYPFQYYRR